MHEEWEPKKTGVTPRGEISDFAKRHSNVEAILSRLKGVSGRGDQYMALCPAHDDHQPSLSIRVTDDGTVLVNCFAGCEAEAIMEMIDLPMRALFPHWNGQADTDGRQPTHLLFYVYEDEQGHPLFRITRKPGKKFMASRWCRGEWLVGLGSGQTVLYRLPEVVQAVERGETIVVVEGEKDVHTVRFLGFTATCNPFGAGKWRREYSDSLREADVVIIPDNDQPGEAHARQVARSLRNVAVRVRVLRLPDAKPGGDVSDWMQEVGPEAARAQFPQLLAAAQDEEQEDTSDDDEDDSNSDFVCLLDVRAEEVNWLWEPYIPRGKVTLMVGRPGVGKSFCSLAIATCVSLGSALPLGEARAPGTVLILAAEDGLADTIRPRIGYMHADLSRVFVLRPEALPLVLPDEIPRLEREALAREAVLIIIDPFMSFVGSRDVNAGSEMRVALDSLARLAAVTDAAVLVVHHPNKRTGGVVADRIMGSVALPAAARSVLFVGSDPGNPDDRALVQIKMNLAPEGRPIGFEIRDALFYWKPDTGLTAERMFDAEESSDEISARDEAADFLTDALADGPRPAKEVEKEARELGIASTTLRTARRKLRIKSKRHSSPGSRGQGHWEWQLPDHKEDDDA